MPTSKQGFTGAATPCYGHIAGALAAETTGARPGAHRRQLLWQRGERGLSAGVAQGFPGPCWQPCWDTPVLLRRASWEALH